MSQTVQRAAAPANRRPGAKSRARKAGPAGHTSAIAYDPKRGGDDYVRRVGASTPMQLVLSGRR